ncbi:serine/threonine-protein kinase [Nocardia higoensis]|uniref:serine/threonine-protein kinase n=1 Tax=Nocardia higoensis TaxID=228599 RepID=UPI0003029EA9|nr:serine/threonine-protein kinase [Nocardia higoensis]
MDGSGRRVGTRFGPYELRALLGKGGMGEVYEAFDTARHRLVAVKLLSEALAQDPAYQERFRRESQAAARLAEPHVIPIHDWGDIDGVLFLDMRLVAGSDLRTILHRTGPLEPGRAVRLIEQIAAALDAAHAEGLVHRDVKPANVLVTDADFAYLADFGIAHSEGDSAITQVGMAVGSYIYMAPERFDSGPVTGRSDIYSLACVLYECLTGGAPFPGANMTALVKAHMSEPPPRASERHPGVPPAVDAVIATAMAKNPADRYATALEFTRAARAALGMRDTGPAPVAVPKSVPQSTGQTTRAVFGKGAAGPGVFGATPVAPPQTGAVPADTGAGPTFVVHAPDPARFGAKSEPGVASTLLPPESTGEVSAVIHPTGPTEIRASEFEFSPLPTQEQQVVPAVPGPVSAPASGAIPQVRPFPDAHLYDEGQRLDQQPVSAPIPVAPPTISTPRPASAFAEVAGREQDDQPYSDEHPSGTYRVPAGFAKGAADPARQYDAPESGPQGYVGAPAYSSDADHDELIAPATTRYIAPPVREIPQPAPETRRYPESAESPTGDMPGGHPRGYPVPPQGQSGYGADGYGRDPYAGQAYGRQPDHYADQHAGRQSDPYGAPQDSYGAQADPYGMQSDPYAAPADPYDGRPDPYAGQVDPYGGHADPYGAQADPYGAQADPYGAEADPYAQQHDPYAPQHAYARQDAYGSPGYAGSQGYQDPYGQPKRSLLLPILAACAVVAVLAVGGLVVWRVLGGNGEDTAAGGPATTATTAALPGPGAGAGAGAPTTSAARTTTTTSTPVRLPAGSTPCGSTASSANGNAAAGNGVTSCPFAEEVRRAYAAQASPGSNAPQTVTAVSPVTGRSYTMTCTPSGGLVTCTGGENAIVYVY